MITENLSTLQIHKLTQEQYDRELVNNTLDKNAIYLTPEEKIDMSKYATVEELNDKADISHTHTEYMVSTNPVGTGAFSMNRALDSEIGDCSHAEGYHATASGEYSHAEGSFTKAFEQCSHAEGYGTEASGMDSHAEGSYAKAIGSGSHAEGNGTEASGTYSHAEGNITKASGVYSHAEGYDTTTSGRASHAEGYETEASGMDSHAEGYDTTASGRASHAEGGLTEASEDYSHAEGCGTKASGKFSHAEGNITIASGRASHAEGYHIQALDYQHVQGHYNDLSTTAGVSSGTSTGTAFVIGNGTEESGSNAFRVTYDGKPYSCSSMTTTGADYAEFFEWLDLNPNAEDRRGYFVTLNEDKIKIAEPNDYILGIVSALPAVIGNGDECWRGRYILDDFGAFIIEEFEYEEKISDKESGETKTITKTGTKYKENSDYDPTATYIQREDRPEWDAVGMMGVLAVRDDGTCEVNGYCKVAEGGIATTSETGYRVIKRVSDNVIKVVFR